jgi:hypothetical protein
VQRGGHELVVVDEAVAAHVGDRHDAREVVLFFGGRGDLFGVLVSVWGVIFLRLFGARLSRFMFALESNLLLTPPQTLNDEGVHRKRCVDPTRAKPPRAKKRTALILAPIAVRARFISSTVIAPLPSASYDLNSERRPLIFFLIWFFFWFFWVWFEGLVRELGVGMSWFWWLFPIENNACKNRVGKKASKNSPPFTNRTLELLGSQRLADH